MKLANKFYILFLVMAIILAGGFFYFIGIYNNKILNADNLRLDEQESTILAVKKVQPAVVNIIIYEQTQVIDYNRSTGDKSFRNQKTEKGKGTGFLISADGLIITNKHVINAVDDKIAAYRVILNSGKEYYAQLIGKDPIYDLAVIKIFDKNLPSVELGDSDKLQIGTTVIAIGNALGRYQNSATKGIVSGLGRSIVASDQLGRSESLDNVIQTDAQINTGNSGGPLIDLNGKVVGINSATDAAGASIGFAIPINDARGAIKSVKETGKISRPKLGIMYKMITPEIARDYNLPRDSGAWVTSADETTPAVLAGSAAEKAGIIQGDIIYEINAIKLSGEKSLLSIVQRYKPGNKIGLKVQRGNKIMTLTAVLDKF